MTRHHPIPFSRKISFFSFSFFFFFFNSLRCSLATRCSEQLVCYDNFSPHPFHVGAGTYVLSRAKRAGTCVAATNVSARNKQTDVINVKQEGRKKEKKKSDVVGVWRNSLFLRFFSPHFDGDQRNRIFLILSVWHWAPNFTWTNLAAAVIRRGLFFFLVSGWMLLRAQASHYISTETMRKKAEGLQERNKPRNEKTKQRKRGEKWPYENLKREPETIYPHCRRLDGAFVSSFFVPPAI